MKPLVLPGGYRDEAHAVVAVRARIEAGGLVAGRNLAEYELRNRFRRLEGTGSVVLAGGESPEIRISVDLPRAVSRGLEVAELAQTVARETSNIPAGNAREGEKELVVVSAGRPASVEELSRLILPSDRGALALEDIAETARGKARRKSLFIWIGNKRLWRFTAGPGRILWHFPGT